MRWLLLFVACSTLGAADLASVGPVYFWPMSAALDQYIAERAAAEGLFKVTLDPADAKSVMTDHVDSRFFAGMQEIFKEDKPPAPEPKTDEAKEGDRRKQKRATRRMSPPPAASRAVSNCGARRTARKGRPRERSSWSM